MRASRYHSIAPPTSFFTVWAGCQPRRGKEESLGGFRGRNKRKMLFFGAARSKLRDHPTLTHLFA